MLAQLLATECAHVFTVVARYVSGKLLGKTPVALPFKTDPYITKLRFFTYTHIIAILAYY